MKKIAVMFYAILCLSQALVADITWNSASVRISSLGVNASDPQIKLDANGNSVAVWIESNLIKSSNLPLHATSWSPASTLSGSTATEPQLVIDYEGNATAIWVENGIIKTSTQLFNDSWGPSLILSGSEASSPHMVVDNSGNIVAVWTRNGKIESSTHLFGGSWPSTPDVISKRVADSPFVAISDSGNVNVVWHSVVSSIDTVYFASKKLKSSWSTQIAISAAGINSINPKIAMDSLGNSIGIWFTYRTLGLEYLDVYVQAASQMVNDSWSAPINISSAGISNPSSLISSIEIDGAGNAIAVWNITFDGATYNYQAAVLPQFGVWSAPLDLLSLNPYAQSIDLAMDEGGHAQLVFMLYNSPSLKVEAGELDIFANTLQFSQLSTLSQGDYNGFPKVAISTTGNTMYTIAAWEFYNGSTTVIRALRGTGTMFAPPTHLSVTQSSTNYHLITDYYNTIKWTPSTNPATTGYLIFRNGILIGQVSSSVNHYIDNNQEQNGSVIYGIAAISSSAQSEIVTVQYN